MSGFLIAVIILTAIALLYPGILVRARLNGFKSADGRISVAVMPFQNMTNDSALNIWQDGTQDILITSLSNSERLKVRQTESINTPSAKQRPYKLFFNYTGNRKFQSPANWMPAY